MILDYHRPDSIEQALELLARPEPQTRPLGGGSVLNAPSNDRYDVVDLQLLKLDRIVKKGSSLQIGAAATLQALLENAHIPAPLQTTIRSEAARNLRQVATVAGSLVSADGRSPFSTACLALDAVLLLQPGDEKINYGDLLPLRGDFLPKRLITSITLRCPLSC
jgi:CO/xanthine dehydrogenase FAD-binding subunit